MYLEDSGKRFSIMSKPGILINCTTFAIIKKIIMAATKITVNSNGSLKVEGDFEVVDKTGAAYDLGGRVIVSFCRCGLSNNKPFCDGSHNGHFEHNAVAFNLPPKK
jgi:CDGSH-type Zn-finger protein